MGIRQIQVQNGLGIRLGIRLFDFRVKHKEMCTFRCRSTLCNCVKTLKTRLGIRHVSGAKQEWKTEGQKSVIFET